MFFIEGFESSVRPLVKVGYYSCQMNGDVGCPNDGEKVPVEYICLYPDKDSTRLLTVIECTDNLGKWLARD